MKNAVKITPTNNRVLIQRYRRPEKTPSGLLHIPDAYRHDQSNVLWEVVALGPGGRSRKGIQKPMDCKPGDIVEAESAFIVKPLGIDSDDNEPLFIVSEDHISHIRWRP